MSVVTSALIGSLSPLSWSHETLAAAPPPAVVERAAKGLRKLCEQSSQADASDEQKRISLEVVATLLDGAAAQVLCDVVATATGAIDAIDRDVGADTVECGAHSAAPCTAALC